MSPEATLQLWAAVCLIHAIFLLARHWYADAGVGLLFSYVLGFCLIHWLAPALYLLPWYDGMDRTLVIAGLRESTYAMVAFAIGAESVARAMRRPAGVRTPDAAPVDQRVITLYLAAGVILYFVVIPAASQIPTLGALVSIGPMLVMAAFGLTCWNAWLRKQRSRIWRWLAVSAWLPLVTVMVQGFLGYGFAAALTVFTFVASFYRPRWKVLVCAVALGYLGLSIYVTYMRDRNEIRSVVWGGAVLADRTSRLYTTFTDIEWFNLYDDQHLWRVDRRLNQGFLVGAAIVYLEDRPGLFARGATIWDAALALVPRVLWADKPVFAGSGNLVSDFTGFVFAENTSVGVGQVLESYANFGTPGVLVIFAILGALVVLVDRKCRIHLNRSNVHGFTLWFLPGLALTFIGGSFVDLVGTAGSALVVATVLKHAIPLMLDASPAPSEESGDQKDFVSAASVSIDTR